LTPPLLVATHNAGKAREIAALLAGCGRDLVALRDRGIREAFEETGATYEANAAGKARHYAAVAGLAAIADDSGLEVEALGGRPGIHSARYGGAGLDDAGRNRLLLEELRGVGEDRRGARYLAVAAIARPDGACRTFAGSCDGRIALAPAGDGGFGYDPLFFFPPAGVTFAALPPADKDRVSHRGRAFRALAEFLVSEAGRMFLAGADGPPTRR
jgi:XTP/dITP diphosphohydrolase